MSRKDTPNLMGDLLSGKKDSKPAEQQASKPEEEAPRPAEEQKLKRTFYLSQAGTNALEELQYLIKRMASLEDRSQISYSAIVEAALLQSLEDLQQQGQASKIASKLLE